MLALVKKIILVFCLFSAIAGPLMYKGLSNLKLVNENYHKLTSDKQYSLILGTSRAAQGLRQDVINDILESQYGRAPIYNYAFNVKVSPYGPAYLSSIKKKIKTDGRVRGLFVLAIDPWSVSILKSNTTNDLAKLREHGSFIEDLTTVSVDPNIEFFYKHFDYSFYHLLLSTESEKKSDELAPITPQLIEKLTKAKLASYRSGMFVTHRFSDLRYDYFEQMIAYLQTVGDVVLVRLPVSREMAELEEDFLPGFSRKVGETAEKFNISFFDLISESGKYLCVDGHHLYKEDAQKVSQALAMFIQGQVKTSSARRL